jgi:hypothetical protein
VLKGKPNNFMCFMLVMYDLSTVCAISANEVHVGADRKATKEHIVSRFYFVWSHLYLFFFLFPLVYRHLLLVQLRGGLETLLAAVTSDGSSLEEQGQFMPHVVNSELFAREPYDVGLILSLLVCSRGPRHTLYGHLSVAFSS